MTLDLAVPRVARPQEGSSPPAGLDYGDGVLTDDEEEDLARQAQNPVADLISLPLQFNFNFKNGEKERTQTVLNIQPVYPVNMGSYNLINRVILPVIDQPDIAPGVDGEFGLGDVQWTTFLSPASSEGLLWGAGPALRIPTATEDVLGSEKWSAGPAAVALVMPRPWVFGALAQNVWSFAGSDSRDEVSELLVQPFVNYNFDGGYYINTAPVITANWKADRGGDTWTVPLGGGGGRVFGLGGLPINAAVQAYYNVARPEIVGRWSARFQIQFLFPKPR